METGPEENRKNHIWLRLVTEMKNIVTIYC